MNDLPAYNMVLMCGVTLAFILYCFGGDHAADTVLGLMIGSPTSKREPFDEDVTVSEDSPEQPGQESEN